MSITERLQAGLSYLLSAILMVSVVVSVVTGFWFNAFLGLSAFVLTYVPSLIRKNYRIHVPTEFELLFVFFIFSALYLGEVRSYYIHYWWWDIFLHTFSGVLLGMVGYVLVYVLNTEKAFPIRLTPFFIALFSITFAVTLGVVWEIFEFSLDYFFDMSMQGVGVSDTMTDLMVDFLGAFFVATLGYFYSKKVSFPVVDQLIQKFVEKNPQLFRRRRKK